MPATNHNLNFHLILSMKISFPLSLNLNLITVAPCYLKPPFPRCNSDKGCLLWRKARSYLGISGICLWNHRDRKATAKPHTFRRIFMPPRPRPAGGIERSGCAYVRPSIDQVKIFVKGRISRPINGSKLIFHMRMYLYETGRNIQEPWPHYLYFTVHWLRTLARLSRLRFLSKVES